MARRSPASSLARSQWVRDAGRRVRRRYRDRVAGASQEDLDRLDGRLGRLAVAGLFRVAPLVFDRRRAGDLRAAVEWRIKEADGGASVHTLVFTDGRCRARAGVVADPDLTIEIGVADFVRLTAGTADLVRMFTEGRLRVTGDLGLALRLPRLLRAPRR
jgi:alkyl sulfatase BDS1-like metallo-beta-lactamase superfamily hydrolase